MSDNAGQPDLRRLLPGRTPLALVGAPPLFVIFGAFLPVAVAARFPVAFELGVGAILAATSTAVFALERRLERAHSLGPAAQIRELVGIMVGAALITWALLRLPPAALVRSGELWSSLTATLLVFALASAFRRRVARRQFFLAAAARMLSSPKEGPGTDAVAAVTRELSVEAGEAAEALASIRRWLVFFLVWLVLLLVVEGWALGRAGAVEQIGVCASSMVFVAGLVSIGRSSEEQRLLAHGLVPDPKRRSLATGTAVVLFGAAALLSVVLSLLPAAVSQATLAAVGSWILWLLSLIPSHGPRSAAPPPPPPVMHRPPTDIAERLRAIAPVHGFPLVATILTYLAWSIAAAGAAGFLWLLVAPLFRMHGRRISLASAARRIGERVVEALRRWATEFRNAVDGLRNARGEGVSRSGVLDREPRAGRARKRRRSFVSAFLRGSDRRFAGAFRRLAKWGGERGALFASSLGPQEYAEMLASRVPSARPRLERVADLYERHFFAPDPLSGRERSDYFRIIKEVTSSDGR